MNEMTKNQNVIMTKNGECVDAGKAVYVNVNIAHIRLVNVNRKETNDKYLFNSRS